jgi:hypothetical protein
MDRAACRLRKPQAARGDAGPIRPHPGSTSRNICCCYGLWRRLGSFRADGAPTSWVPFVLGHGRCSDSFRASGGPTSWVPFAPRHGRFSGSFRAGGARLLWVPFAPRHGRFSGSFRAGGGPTPWVPFAPGDGRFLRSFREAGGWRGRSLGRGGEWRVSESIVEFSRGAPRYRPQRVNQGRRRVRGLTPATVFASPGAWTIGS